MNKTKRYVYWAVYAVLYCSVIQRYIWQNQFVQLIPDVIIFYICIFQKGLTNRIAKSNSVSKILGNSIIYLYISFFILGFISDIINIVNPLTSLWGGRMIIRYGLLFMLIYKNLDYNDLNKVLKILDVSFYINAILVFQQFFTNSRGDSMGGIWGGNGNLAIYILLLSMLYSANYFHKKMSFVNYIIRISLFYMFAIWAEIKMLYFILPICIYGSYILFNKFSLKHIMILVIAWFFAIPFLTKALSLYYEEDYVSQTLDREKLQNYNQNNYGFTEESLNRGTIFIKSNLFLKSTKDIIIGHGLGSGTISQFFGSNISEQYKKTYYDYFTMSYLLFEVGYWGLCIFIIIHIILLYRFFTIYKNTNDLILKYWSALGVLSTSIAFLMIYYNSSPLKNYYFGYIFWAICCIAIRERIKQLSLNKT